MRKEFKLTAKQYKSLIDACKAVPYMVFGGVEPTSPQENANSAWEATLRKVVSCLDDKCIEYISIQAYKVHDKWNK